VQTLLLVHHSHTDVGYTDAQARIAAWQAAFIRQALAAAETPGEAPFKWVCETFWGVEQFLAAADATERARFIAAIHAGRIGLSASYLNFSELPDAPLLERLSARAVDFGRSVGWPLRCAMSADINGHGWGFAGVLAGLGVENLFTCVHTHHGRYPLERPQQGFWWEAPGGERLLVWSGEHYHFGNALGVAPGAVSSYSIKDDCDAAMIFGDAWAVAERRLPRYAAQLAAQGYPFDTAAVMVSGLRTDNGPPSLAIRDFCVRWNAVHGAQLRLEMATLEDVFARLRPQAGALPVYRGDWPDWWSDGPSGDAPALRLFREAQRRLERSWALAAAQPPLPAPPPTLDTELGLFAEHTFGHAAAMNQPWALDVQALRARKLAYAAAGLDAVVAHEERQLAALGAAAPAPGLPLRFRALNPWAAAWAGPLRLPLAHYEFNERGLHTGIRLADAQTGVELPCRLESTPGGGVLACWLELAAGAQRDLLVSPQAPGAPATGDPADPEAWRAAPAAGSLETPWLRLDWALPAGIVALRAADDSSLLRADRREAPFLPVHERTPMLPGAGPSGVRAAMGLNRKGPDVQRERARVGAAWQSEREALYRALAFDIECAGLAHCRLELRAWQAAPRLDVALRFHKESRWEPENVYLALPFGLTDGVLHLLKAGALVAPRDEQIPGTLTDFYALQEGFIVTDGARGLALAMPDQPLLQLGPLDPGERLLAGDPRLASDPALPYAWLMTNYWETNFAPTLGGFHEFRYALSGGAALATPAAAADACRDLAREVFCFRLGGEPV
jgi:hypothetical protein